MLTTKTTNNNEKILFLFAAVLLSSVGLHAETTVIPHPFTVGKIDDQIKAVYFTDQNFSKDEWKESYVDGQRLLTAGEWEYVLQTRTINDHTADQLRGWATIIKDEGDPSKTEDILQLGLVLLPDDWGYTHDYDNNVWYDKASPRNRIFNLGNTFSNNVFTQTQWAEMQQAGAVFLPCEPREEKVYGSGDYWSSTKNVETGDISYALFQTSRTTPADEQFVFNNLGSAEQKRYVRLVQDHVTITLDENVNNTDLLTPWQTSGKQVNVQLIRSLTPGMYNTFCLPFDLTEQEVKDTFGEEATVAKFTSGTLSTDKQILEIEFESCTTIEAGTPYLIEPTNAVANPIFYNRTIKCTTASGETFSSADKIEYLGIINPHKLEAGDKKYLFLQANNTLTWSKEGDTSTMKGMRGYFYVPQMEDGVTIPKGCPARLSVRPAPQTPTASEVVRGVQCTMHSEKYIYNNRVVIIRNGEMRDIFGNIIK